MYLAAEVGDKLVETIHTYNMGYETRVLKMTGQWGWDSVLAVDYANNADQARLNHKYMVEKLKEK